MLALNCSTWCENSKNPRSDCHGWSATPIYELVSCVAGIKPVGFNCDTIEIQPRNFDKIDDYVAKLPFANGLVVVEKKQDKISVLAPDGVKMIVKLKDKTVEVEKSATFNL